MDERGANGHHAVERTNQRCRFVVIVDGVLPVVDRDAVARRELPDLVAHRRVLQADELQAGKAQQWQQLLEAQRAPRPARMADAALP
ncbi:MAG: hypothetical protein E6H47_00310 [Betaproteobacteria bacterium]|nr:MAG: hypothetical protein E6H47_00310 [Betaproteobacteria bacterium]